MLGDASTETMYTDSDNNNNYLQYDNGDDNRYKYVHCLSYECQRSCDNDANCVGMVESNMHVLC